MRFVEQTVKPGGRLLGEHFLCWLFHGWRYWNTTLSDTGTIHYHCVKCDWKWIKWSANDRVAL